MRGERRETVEDFGNCLGGNLSTLASEVRYRTYRPKALLRVEIATDAGTPRPLSIPAVRDRVLQSAVARVLTPVFEAEFEDYSLACPQRRLGRAGRSARDCVA